MTREGRRQGAQTGGTTETFEKGLCLEVTMQGSDVWWGSEGSVCPEENPGGTWVEDDDEG